VKQNVEKLRGRVHISSIAGQGTTIRLVLPLTLAVVDGTLVTCGGESYVIPTSAIVESLRPAKEMVNTLGGHTEFLNVRGQLIQLHRLARIFQSRPASEELTESIAVVVESEGQKSALLVDDVIAQRQIVVKPLYVMDVHTEHFSGATILPDGRPGLIIDVDRVCRATARRSGNQVPA
jgi:two-component system chemotaxis sensor kinase CheA